MIKNIFLVYRMLTDVTGGPGFAVVAGDVLALRGTGLAAAETWALLCQAAQALQDLFLSSKLKIVFILLCTVIMLRYYCKLP